MFFLIRETRSLKTTKASISKKRREKRRQGGYFRKAAEYENRHIS
jgi:hypothetical protein